MQFDSDVYVELEDDVSSEETLPIGGFNQSTVTKPNSQSESEVNLYTYTMFSMVCTV